MKQLNRPFGLLLTLSTLAMCLSCSKQATAPVQESELVGKWQRIDKPAISMTFLKNGTFNADVAGQRLAGGTFQLINGEHLVVDCDASSPKVGLVTNTVSVAGGELRITPANGQMERYKRLE